MVELAKYTQLDTWSQTDHLGKECHIRDSHWSLPLSDQVFSGSWSQISLGECKFTLLSPCITSVPATMTILFMRLLNNDKSGWEKRLATIYRKVHHIYLIFKLLCCWGHFGGRIYMETNIFPPFAHMERSTSCPTVFAPSFPVIFLPRPCPFSQTMVYSP